MAPDKLLAEWFWTDRWIGSSAFLLPMEARGVYREMLTQAWRRGARLPNDHEAIRRAIGATAKEWGRSWPLLERFWRVDGDALVNDTQREIYTEAKARFDKASERGSRGAHARHTHNLRSAQAHAQAQPEHKPPVSSLRSQIESSSNSLSARARSLESDEIAERGGRLVEKYGELFVTHRRGARYRPRPNLDWYDACDLCRTWDDARLEKLAALVLTTDDEFISKTDRSFKIFAMKASWADDKLTQWENEHGVTV